MSFASFVIVAIAMVMVIEGLLYGLFPNSLKKAIKIALEMPESQLRFMGLTLAMLGFLVLWLMGGMAFAIS